MTNATSSAQKYLEALAEELAISDARYEQAETSYHSLGRWLNRDASTVRKFSPLVYVQGSFGLGTVIKPLNDAEDYDVDAVCELRALSKAQLTQAQLKEQVRNEIEAYRESQAMKLPLGEGRRCWTLNYADGAQFHMDIVPALPNGADVRMLLEQRGLDAKWAGTAISITDNEHLHYRSISQDWPRSNPKGYLQWFRGQMAVAFEKRRKVIAEASRATVEQIPDYRVRTPLQSSIMILKRHRDLMFAKDEINCCPISIILTTLAAHSYGGEESIADALLSILSRMEQHIHVDGRQHLIPNPSDPLENFADKWEKHPERRDAFFTWLAQARKDFGNAANMDDNRVIAESLITRIGAGVAKRAENRVVAGQHSGGLLRAATVASSLPLSQPSFGSEPRVPTKPSGFA